MKKYRVYLYRVEEVVVEAQNEDEAYDAAIDECEGFGDLTEIIVNEEEEENA